MEPHLGIFLSDKEGNGLLLFQVFSFSLFIFELSPNSCGVCNFANRRCKLNYKLRTCVHLKKMDEDWCFNHFKGGGNGGDLRFGTPRRRRCWFIRSPFVFVFLGIVC